ncbi:MAG: phosphoribosylformylglycinamidine synthase I [Planctomycetes bacterium]|nr:phosphoribosylformylglycinamidine synthase I [Planctomycetota bacterium]
MNERRTLARAIVLRAAGSNCDREAVLALELAGARVELLHLYRLLEQPRRLDDAQILLLPGGFSYGDYVAAGRLYAHELRARLSDALVGFVARGGHVLGICNGFQVLVETGLLEGPAVTRGERPRSLALENNLSNRFECRWVELEALASACPYLEPGLRLPVPVAHGEGRLAVRDAATLEALYAQRQVALRYVDPAAASGADPRRVPYPACPNGSLDAIAGLCDASGRVLGLMPHPERNVRVFHHPTWTRLSGRREGEGLRVFRGLVACAQSSLTPARV